MSKIKVMDEILANKIAAGEVVEKIASVVKELVENSIDAKSTEIKVELLEAGTKEIKVIDNGIGMEKEDAILAFSRHATSKIKKEDDLYNIDTLGFRGEALASIASVSKVLLKTSDGNEGTLIQIEGGKVKSTSKSDLRVGTSITISDLFYNTPARLKHMKSLYSELAGVTDYMNKLSLSNPNIKFILINNGNVLLNTDGSGDLLKTIKSVYGIDITRKMLPIKGSNDDYDIYGFISKPEVHRSTRSHITVIVNGRIVRNNELNRIINEAYHSYKPDNRYPIVVVNINTDPSLIDVNIHPTKMDIKFSKLEELSSLIEKLIKESISSINLIPKIEVDKEEIITSPNYEKKDTYQETIDFDYDMVVSEDELFYEKLPLIYPVGLVHGTYIIGQDDTSMYLIDQHAAKERINYEYYKKKMGSPKKETIELLIPITIELTTSEFIIIKNNFNVFEDMGITIEEFGINSIIIKSVPSWLENNEIAIRNIVDIVIDIESKFNLEKFRESVAIMMSCKLAIKANQNITLEEMEELLKDLRKCDNPFNCPHGRPTIIKYTKTDLEKLFKRSGFDIKK